jgi:hypothetical protein
MPDGKTFPPSICLSTSVRTISWTSQLKMSSQLENLPDELFYMIFDEIKAIYAVPSWKHQYHKPFVFLSLTSKRCRSIVAPYVFDHLFLNAVSFEQLAQELTDCAQTLSHLGYNRAIQNFTVTVRGSDYDPQEVAKVVKLLETFPNLKRLSVKLGFSNSFRNKIYSDVQKILRGRSCQEAMLFAGRYHWWCEKAT